KPGDRRPGLGQRRGAKEDLRRKVVGQALDDSRPVLREHPARDRDRKPDDRLVDVEHVGDVAVAVAPLAKASVAIDVDPPIEHVQPGKADRSRAEQLDQPARRGRIPAGRDVAYRELHQVTLNWSAMATPLALFSRT